MTLKPKAASVLARPLLRSTARAVACRPPTAAAQMRRQPGL
jgi:hypothetical protein